MGISEEFLSDGAQERHKSTGNLIGSDVREVNREDMWGVAKEGNEVQEFV
jgi:hypothetical protein